MGTLIVWLAVSGAVASWLPPVVLVRAAFVSPRITSLTERAVRSVTLAIVATIAALLLTLGHQLGTDLDQVLLLLAIALLDVPALWWLYLYLTGKFGR